MNEEGLRKTEHSKIFIGSPIAINQNELQHKLQSLTAALNKGEEAIKEALVDVVPTYVPAQVQNENNAESEDSALDGSTTVFAS